MSLFFNNDGTVTTTANYNTSTHWGLEYTNTTPMIFSLFCNYGECGYCGNNSSNNLSMTTTLVCVECFKKVLDLLLVKPNSKLISIINEHSK